MNIADFLTKEDYKLGEILIYKKNTCIKKEQDYCKEIFIVLEGEIKISSYQINGKEDIYNIINAGNMFANNLIFSDYNYYLGDVIALKDAKLFRIEKENFLNILQKNTAFLNAFCTISSQETIKEKLKIKILSKSNIEERFCYYLSLNNGTITSSIQSLADILFLQRPSLSRVISQLIARGIIKKENKTITLLKQI